MTEEQIEELGVAADDLDAALHFTKIPVPDAMKIDALKSAIIKARDKLMEVVRASSDHDPWEGNPTLFGDAA